MYDQIGNSFTMFDFEVKKNSWKILRNFRSLMNEKTIISVCNKIAMQINCKMGGELWKLEVEISWKFR